MERFGDQGVLFSKEYFTPEMVARLSRPLDDVGGGSQTKPIAAPMPLPEPTEEAAFASAWAEMSKDPEFATAIEKMGYSEAQALAEFKKAMSTPVAADVDDKTAGLLKVQHVVSSQDGKIVHTIDSEPILSIPLTHPQALMMSRNAKIAIDAAFVVIDTLSVVAAAAGVVVIFKKGPLASVMQSELGTLLREVNSPMAQEWQRLIKGGKTVEGIRKLLSFLRGTTNLKSVIETFVDSLKWYEKAIAAAQLLAAITLLIASLGASLSYQIGTLAASVALLAIDVGALVAAIAT